MGTFALGALGLVGWLVVGRTSLTASVAVDGRGQESLELVCEKCADGAVASVGNRAATFRSGRATLSLERPLEVGNNRLSVVLSSGGTGETVDLLVPVDYRLRSNLEGLAEAVPKLKIEAQTLPETAVAINSQPVIAGPDGKGWASIDVSAALTGEASKVERLERRIPYTVTRRRGEPKAGELALGIGIVPLVIEAPGSKVVTEARDFTLAGTTQKGATVDVAGRSIPVDAAGRFAQLMSVSAVGETTITVRASAAQLAPRMVPIQVRRVASLRGEALRVRSRAERSYRTLVSAVEAKRGSAVELAGEVVEARVTGYRTILLLDVGQDCPARPCLARLVYGDKYPAAPAEKVTAYGELLGAVEGTRLGTRIPEVRVDFLVKGPPP